ncbi:MAG: right-handed parallel beta-helix repeat-containing protein [Myxococcota bacterium]
MGVALAQVLALPASGCHRSFLCAENAQCHLGGTHGRCEATGFCSFPDDACASGHRYGEHASADLAHQCADAMVAGGTDSSSGAPSIDQSIDESDGSTGSTTGDGTTDDGTTTTGIPTDCPPLVESGPLVVKAHGEMIEGLRITAAGVPAISVSGFDDVVIRNCEIHHDGGPGISFAAAHRLTIEDVVIVHDREEPGAHEHRNQANITGSNSEETVIERVRVTRGSTGIELAATPGARLTDIEGHDIRGPGPPASFIHLSGSDDAVIDGFSIVNPLDTGRPGNLVELHESSNVTVRNGLLDGHNAEFGYGVVFQQTSGQHAGGLVEDVDTLRMTNGSFSGFPAAFDLVFRRTRARQNICEILSVPIDDCDVVGPNGGCVPGSNGRSWTSAPRLSGILIEDSVHFDLCHPPVWPESAFVGCDGNQSAAENGDCGLNEEDFTPRAPIALTPCWERDR